MSEEGTEYSLKQYLLIVLQWWWLIAAIPIGVFAYGHFFAEKGESTLIYQAEARILVQQASPAGLISDIYGSQDLALIHKELLKEDSVLLETARRLGLKESAPVLRSWLTVEVVEQTPIIRIVVKHPDPEIAPNFANTLAHVFITMTEEQYLTRVARLQSLAASIGLDYGDQFLTQQLTALGNLVVIREASVPGTPILIVNQGMKLLLWVPLAAIAGLCLAFGLEYLAGRVRSPDKMKQEMGVEPIGVIPKWRRGKAKKREAVILIHPESHFAEAYRQTLARLQAFWLVGQKTVKIAVVTSPGAAEGKTTTAVNMALALTEVGKNVVLVDADLQRPDVHRWFELANRAGLSNVLADPSVDVQSMLQPTMIENLRVMTSGPRPPRQAQLLRRAALERVVQALQREADTVIFDGPPMLASSDAIGLVSCGDGTILVADANRTRSSSLKRAVQQVEELGKTNGSSRLGVILNRFRPPFLAYYAYYRYYEEYQYYYGAREQVDNRAVARDGTGSGVRSFEGWWHVVKVRRVKKVVFRRAKRFARRHK